jgi:hypothetical protein
LRCKVCNMPTQRRNEFRERMLQHLEAALACADETQDGEAGSLIEKAMDVVRVTALREQATRPPKP